MNKKGLWPALLLFFVAGGGMAQSGPPAPVANSVSANEQVRPAGSALTQTGIDFVSTEGKFRIRFPGFPQKRTLIAGENPNERKKEFRLDGEDSFIYRIQFESVEDFPIIQTEPEALIKTSEIERQRELEKPVQMIFSEKRQLPECKAARMVGFSAGQSLFYQELYAVCNQILYHISIKGYREKTDYKTRDGFGTAAAAFIDSFTPLADQTLDTLSETRLEHSGIFRDEEMRFRAIFPKNPEITEEINPNGTSDVRYQSEKDNLVYRISADLMTDTFSFSKMLRERLYDNFRDGFVETSGSRILADRPVVYQKVNARELVLTVPDRPGNFYLRLLALNGKLYTLSVALKEGSPKSYDDVALRREAEKFFDSFEKLPELHPPKYYGIVFQGVYTTEFFGFSLKLPTGWKTRGGQLLVTSDKAGTPDRMFEEPDADIHKPILLRAFSQIVNPERAGSLKITGISFDFGDGVKMGYLVKEISSLMLEKSPGLRLERGFRPRRMGGKTFWVADFELATEAGKVKFRNYLVRHRRYILTIQTIHRQTSELVEVERAIGDMEFF